MIDGQSLFEANDIDNLLEQILRRFFHGMISRKFLDTSTNIPKVSRSYSIWRRYTEKFLNLSPTEWISRKFPSNK